MGGFMKHAKRLKQSLKKIDKIEEITCYTLCNTPMEFEYRRYIQELKNDLKYLSTEKKKHRIRFAKKILNGSIFKNISFQQRLKYGLKWIFTGKI
jgi:hypothetical protein